MTKPIKICALYKFAACPDVATLRSAILQHAQACALKGTVLVAPEGINGTISGTPAQIDQFMDWLLHDPSLEGRFCDGEIKYAWADAHPFQRLKVRLKREIVTLRAPIADPTRIVGTYVRPHDWNKLVSQPDVVVIDTRNIYETELGTFKGAIDPKIDTFTGFKDWVATHLDPAQHKKVAMFCTGGIRCEKASAFMLAQGFEQVHHLKGGILAYLDQVPETESLFEGSCFVFDERVSVEAQTAGTGGKTQAKAAAADEC